MIRLLPIIILFLFSCSDRENKSEPETTVPDTTIKEPVKKVVRKYFDFDYTDTVISGFPGEKESKIFVDYSFPSDWGVELGPISEPFSVNKNINFSSKLHLPINFRKEHFLTTYFGNNINYLYDSKLQDSIPSVWWHCEKCKPDTLSYLGYNELGITFPGEEINTTFINYDYHFLLGRKKYRFISFVTYPDEFSIMFCGRFSGGVMGYALFEENENNSKLISIDYTVGMFGNYHRPKEPEIRIAFNELFFIYECFNGGAGGPYTGINKILHFDGKVIETIAEESFLSLTNTGIGEWATSSHFFKDSLSNEVGLKFITSGFFIGNGGDTENDYSYIYNGAPDSFKKKVKKSEKDKSQFTFVYERIFIKGNRKYIKEEKIKFEKLKGEWKEVIETSNSSYNQ